MPGQGHRASLWHACPGARLARGPQLQAGDPTAAAGPLLKVLTTGPLSSGPGVAVCQVRVCSATLVAQDQQPKWGAAETAGLRPDVDPLVRHTGT